MRPTLLLLALAACAAPKPAAPPAGPDLDGIARKFFDAHHLVGLAVGVVRDDTVLLAKGYGTTSVSGTRAVTDSTIFHMASVTKPFVATAVMQLVEQGKVDIDQPVTRYVPYFKMKDPRAAPITVRQVLTHTAGMPDVTDYAWDKPEYDAGALERYIRGLKDSTLIFAPGTKWQYSNIGFELLADLVAIQSGQPFEDYVQQHILTPLRMSKSTLLMTDVDSTLLAMGHEQDSTGAFHPAANYPYNRRHAGSSTLHSNVIDMLRWARGNLAHGTLDGGKILEPGSYDSLWKSQRDMTAELKQRAAQAGVKVPYDSLAIGLSWMLGKRPTGWIVTHSGGDEGFRSDLLLSPDRKIGIVLMTNGGIRDLQQLTGELFDALVAAAPPAA
jgi:CubicO group peptidase (beta-lactamase class C family)